MSETTCPLCGHERRNDPNGLGFDCTNPACVNFPYITEMNKDKPRAWPRAATTEGGAT